MQQKLRLRLTGFPVIHNPPPQKMRQTLPPLAFFLSLALLPPFVLPSCSFPPEFWCSSAEIAAACDVSKQCASWIKQNPTSGFRNGGQSLVRTRGQSNVVVLGDHEEDEGDDDDRRRKHRLELVLLYEALCPDCQEFIIDQLALSISEFGGEFWTHVHLVLYPYGNAEETYDPKKDRWVFRCQHGPEECMGNLIATCAMNSVGNEAKKWFPFVHCMELKSRDGGGKGSIPAEKGDHLLSVSDARKDGESCAKEARLNWTLVSECVGDWKGNLVQHAVAKATPKHEYVPWVILNGKHTEEMQEAAEKDLFKLVCRFMRHPKPFACYKREARQGEGRCYAKSPFRNT